MLLFMFAAYHGKYFIAYESTIVSEELNITLKTRSKSLSILGCQFEGMGNLDYSCIIAPSSDEQNTGSVKTLLFVNNQMSIVDSRDVRSNGHQVLHQPLLLCTLRIGG